MALDGGEHGVARRKGHTSRPLEFARAGVDVKVYGRNIAAHPKVPPEPILVLPGKVADENSAAPRRANVQRGATRYS
jgi:hypothetical protein